MAACLELGGADTAAERARECDEVSAVGGQAPAPEPDRRVLVIVPTYNEIENLRGIVDRLHQAVPSAHVLVVDDASPDGTGRLAEELASADPRLDVLHSEGKLGLGSA